jgi:outer membrane protein TolC
MIRYLIIGLILLTCSHSTLAQADIDDIPKSEKVFLELPPLASLIDSAVKYSPLVAYHQADMKQKLLEYEIVNRRWLENLSMESDIKYGMFDNLLITDDPAGTGSQGIISANKQTRYSAGVGIRIPITDIINRKKEKQISMIAYQKSTLEREKAEQELRHILITQYNNLILNDRILKIKTENMNSLHLQLIMGEKQFANGELSLSEMGALKEIYSKAQIDFEMARSNFFTSYLILEDIVGIQLNALKF